MVAITPTLKTRPFFGQKQPQNGHFRLIFSIILASQEKISTQIVRFSGHYSPAQNTFKTIYHKQERIHPCQYTE